MAPDSWRLEAAVSRLIRFRLVALALLAVLTAAAASRAVRLSFDFSFRNFFLAEHRADDLATAVGERFANVAGNFLVAVLEGDEVFRRDVLAAVTAMAEAAERIPHVDRVFSLATVPWVRAEGGDLSLAPIGQAAGNGADLAAVRRAVLASPLYARRLVSSDGRTTAVLALLEAGHQGIDARAPTIAAFEAAVRQHVPPGFSVRFTGYPVAEAEYARLIWRGFLAAEVAGLLLMAGALYACFHTLVGVWLPLVTVGIATVLTLGVMEVSGQAITMTNASTPLLLLIIGVSETSYFITRFYEDARPGETSSALVVRSVAAVARPAFFAAATTSAGFLSLATGHIGLTRDLGVTMAVGVLIVYAVAFLLVPAVLSLLGPPPPRATAPYANGVATRCLLATGGFAVRHPVTVVVVSVAVVALGALGGRAVAVDQYATRELAPDNPVRATAEVVDATLTGAFQTQIGVRARDGGPLYRPAMLRKLAALEDFLGRHPQVVNSWSIVDYLRELHFAMDPVPGRVLPEDAALIEQYLFLLSSSGRASDVSMLTEPTNRFATVIVGTTDLGTAALLALHRDVQAFVRERLDDALEVTFAGDYWLVTQGADSLVRDLFLSTLGSFVLVFMLVAVCLRSLRLTLLGILPNLVPLSVALAVMGFGGIHLRVGTSILLPVCLGVAVDSTIQFLVRARTEWQGDGDVAGAIRRTLAGTGRGMLFAAVVLVVGFLCFTIPEFAVFRDVGVVGAASLAAAFLANSLLTPALLVLWRPFLLANETAQR